MAKSSFKMEHPLERRQAEAGRIREKYPDRIPVIVERAEKSDVPDIDKKKYLVPADLTVGQFVYVVRKRIKLSPEKAIFIFVKNILPPTAAMMSAIYEENKDEDGFLYMSYSDCEWKAQAGNICVASFDWSCSGICRSADRMKEVHRRCGEVKERDRKIGRKRQEAVDRATVLRYIGEPIRNDGQSS
ncbi:hypothetical protein OIU84_016692 [Salix udensis]|uniref:Autophagy-related protein n=1 Tax=Salix udensis TaxID=889485 RepID=A0AAD6JB24_9ROSI|nr:hypothetical protein OIU84_016692 [Salix udensis]